MMNSHWCASKKTRAPLSLEGGSEMDSILPQRLLALVPPGNDLVLRRIQSLKRCVQACGCKIMTPRYACKMPSSCVSARRAKKTGKKRKPSQTSQKASQKPNQTSQPARSQAKPARKPARSQPKPARKKPSQAATQKRFPLRGLTLQKQRQLLGILPNRISRGHYFAATPARSVLDFESFAGRGHFLDGRVPGASQVE